MRTPYIKISNFGLNFDWKHKSHFMLKMGNFFFNANFSSFFTLSEKELKNALKKTVLILRIKCDFLLFLATFLNGNNSFFLVFLVFFIVFYYSLVFLIGFFTVMKKLNKKTIKYEKNCFNGTLGTFLSY